MAKKNGTKSAHPSSHPAHSRERLIPLGDRILVKEASKAEEMTVGGIIIPPAAQNRKGSKRGTVIAVGPGRREGGETIPLSVSEGDEVIFGWGEEVSVDGEDYVLVRESDVYARIA